MESVDNERQMILACQAIQNTPKLSIRATAKSMGYLTARLALPLRESPHDAILCHPVENLRT